MQNLLQYDEVNYIIYTELRHETKEHTYSMTHMWIRCKYLLICLKTTVVMRYEIYQLLSL
jgi:hypothetical protein